MHGGRLAWSLAIELNNHAIAPSDSAASLIPDPAHSTFMMRWCHDSHALSYADRYSDGYCGIQLAGGVQLQPAACPGFWRFGVTHSVRQPF